MTRGFWETGWRVEWTQDHTEANSRLQQLLSVCSPGLELLPSSLSENRSMSPPAVKRGFQVVPLGAGKRSPIPTEGVEIP